MQQRERAFSLFCQAARSGDADAYYRVGSCYEQGLGLGVGLGSPNVSEAIKYYKQGAGMGSSEAMYSLGYLLIHEALCQMRSFDPEAAATIAGATATLNAAITGTGAAVDGKGSLAAAAAAGGGGGGGSPAFLYPRIRLAPRDQKAFELKVQQGVQLLRAAAERGVLDAAFQLGRVYEQVVVCAHWC